MFFKRLLIVFLLLMCYSGLFANWSYQHTVEEADRLLVLRTHPIVKINLDDNKEKAFFYARWLEKLFAEFRRFSKAPKDPFVLDKLPENLFDLTLKAGDFYFRDYPNRLIVYGIILDTWFKMSERKDSVFAYLYSEDQIYLKDILSCYGDFKRVFKPRRFMLYHVSYMLREVYFISVQELLERPFLYYSPDYSHTVFFKTVVIPETYTFYRYLKTMYPVGKLIKLAKVAYNKKDWQKMTGEEINESEKKYTRKIEKIKFNEMKLLTNFTQSLDKILKVYHTTTKKTLFSR